MAMMIKGASTLREGFDQCGKPHTDQSRFVRFQIIPWDQFAQPDPAGKAVEDTSEEPEEEIGCCW